MQPDFTKDQQNTATTLTHVGRVVSRYGPVVVLAWIGFGKYAKFGAGVLIEDSPLMSWILHVFTLTTVARGLGTMEIVAALLIAVRPLWPRASAVGTLGESLGACRPRTRAEALVPVGSTASA